MDYSQHICQEQRAESARLQVLMFSRWDNSYQRARDPIVETRLAAERVMQRGLAMRAADEAAAQAK